MNRNQHSLEQSGLMTAQTSASSLPSAVEDCERRTAMTQKKCSTRAGRGIGKSFSLFMTALVLTIGLATPFVPGDAEAAPAAGTVIGNQASATYTDGTNVQRTATSNVVQTTVAQRAAFWLREKRVQPTFCVISLEPPHPPYSAHVPHGIKRDSATLRLRENVPIGGEIESKAREELAGYYAHIEATDRAIGRLLAEIDLSNAAVVFTSVHGDMHGSHGVFRKAWPYEESVRIPLLVRFPTGICGKRDDPVSLVDLSRMALAWAGGTEWVLGRNYARISMPSGLKVLNQCPYGWRGIRTTTQKLILIEEDGELAEPTSVHYDLSSDPLESRNILFGREKSAGEAGLWRKLQHEAWNR